MENSGLNSWLRTLLITGVVVFIVSAIQNVFGRMFNLAFEICIFYVPLIVSVLIYLKLRLSVMKLRKQKHISVEETMTE